ncbi:hypothetical protein IEC97_11580 [Neobacillus cucumis]|uniref:hypothetical protein n=1 Tax=Neobacillus cucumis TaxID=1740721 RepID=UPI0018DFE846|nr:hypothetical protein [Neobacillus cucumis]MBI0577999.1 hypothetical protein [Neobacillus cucumis]
MQKRWVKLSNRRVKCSNRLVTFSNPNVNLQKVEGKWLLMFVGLAGFSSFMG